MANALYELTKAKFMQAGFNMSSADIKAALVDAADYTFSQTHEFLDDVPAGALVATSGDFTNKTFTGGVFDADDITFPSVSGDESEAIIIYRDTGSAATSELIAYLDTGFTTLPITPNGGDITVQWSSSGIFKL